MKDRTYAFSMNIRDPANPEDRSGISTMLALDDGLLVFKTSGIYRVRTADSIDPLKQYPETCHTYEKLYSVGVSNSCVARLILQFEKILSLAISNQEQQKKLLSHTWYANKLLLECEQASWSVSEETKILIPQCDQIVETHKNGATIPALPKVEDLERLTEHFLNKAKLFLVATFKLLNIFYGMPLTDNSDADFEAHLSWVKNKVGKTSSIFSFLNERKRWIKILAGLRNAVQHQEEGQVVEIANIELKPDNKIAAPSWRFDLTKKKLGKQEQYTDLVVDLFSYVEGMLIFYESTMLICVKEKLREHPYLDVYLKEEKDIKAECPIAYEVKLKQQ